MSRTIAIIPARKGSKRLPGKNVKLLNGQPLVAYSIRQALAAQKIDKTIVSTDDDVVAKIAAEYGCEVLRRPAELADDNAKTVDVVCHVIRTLRARGEVVDFVVILQPTVPIRIPGKIDEAVALLESTACDAAISHIRVDYFHPNRMKKMMGGRIVPYSEPEIEGVSRNCLPEAYYRDGAIYAVRADLPLTNGTLFGDDVRLVLSDRKYFVNIDEERDWAVAEYLLRHYPEVDTFAEKS